MPINSTFQISTTLKQILVNMNNARVFSSRWNLVINLNITPLRIVMSENIPSHVVLRISCLHVFWSRLINKNSKATKKE